MSINSQRIKSPTNNLPRRVLHRVLFSVAAMFLIVVAFAGAGAAVDYQLGPELNSELMHATNELMPVINEPMPVINEPMPVINEPIPAINYGVSCETVWVPNYPAGSFDIPGFSIPSVNFIRSESSGKGSLVKSVIPPPASYDLRDYNLVTSVKNQSVFGTCWAFGAINSIESNILKQGLVSSPENIDLSELQLAYFMYNRTGVTNGTVLPELSGLEGDDIRLPADEDYLNLGGNAFATTFHLMTGIGVVNESDVPYSSASVDLVLPTSDAVSKNAYVVSDASFVSKGDRDDIKRMIMNNGAGVISYNSNAGYYNFSDNGTNYYQNIVSSTNHGVGLVGWDDNYAKENFRITPPKDGAWLIKNSWDESFGDDGYFWLSYYDTSLSDVIFYKARPASSSDTVYQYDGTGSLNRFSLMNPTTKVPQYTAMIENNFVAKGDEVITDISIATFNPCVDYEISILMGEEPKQEIVSQEYGTLLYCGYHTIHLKNPVTIESGKNFSAYVHLKAPEGSRSVWGNSWLDIPFDLDYSLGPVQMISAYERGQGSCINLGADGADIHSGGNFRIKALSIANTPEPTPVPSWDGSGTEADPYLIGSANDLLELARGVKLGDSYSGKFFKQTSDIDLYGLDWEPIGYGGDTLSSPFSGTFDGNGCNISNLYIKRDGVYEFGLFGFTLDANLKNINLENVYINVTNGKYVGGLVGYAFTNNTASEITNCHSSGSVLGSRYVGGLVGCAFTNNTASEITNCHSSGSVLGSKYVGGLVGVNYCLNGGINHIKNCSASCSVSGFENVGGIIGYSLISKNSNCEIESCFSTGSVTGIGSYVGGFIGGIEASDSTSSIENCYATGDVSSPDGSIVGGFVGYNYADIDSQSSIENCYAFGDIRGFSAVGGIVGYNSNNNSVGDAIITNSVAINPSVYGELSVGRVIGSNFGIVLSGNYANSSMIYDVSGQSDNAVNGTDADHASLETEAFYTTTLGWDFENVWKMGDSSVYPYPILAWEDDGGITEDLPTTSGSYYLKNDINITDTWTVGADVNIILDLKGYDINMTGDSRVIMVESGANLTIIDTSVEEQGKIMGGKNVDTGAGVYVSGNFTLAGGNITGNTASYGSGVYVNSGNFNISNNATVDENNEVYLNTNKVINVTGDSFNGSINNITGESLDVGTTVVGIDSDLILASDVVELFKLQNTSLMLNAAGDKTLVAAIKPKFAAATLSLSTDIAVRFFVNNSTLTQVHDPYVIAQFKGVETRLEPVGNETDEQHVFTFKNISPAEMNETITATLYAMKNGCHEAVIFDSREYSVRQYCTNMFEACGKKNNLTTLCADLLNYGSAAQVFAGVKPDALVNSTMTDKQASWASTTVDLDGEVDFVQGNDTVAVWRAASLNLYSDISVQFKFTTDYPDGLKAVVIYGSGRLEREITEFKDSTYTNSSSGELEKCKLLKFNRMSALDLNYPIEIKIVDASGYESDILTYSVETYATNKQGVVENELGTLVVSMMKYIKSVATKFS